MVYQITIVSSLICGCKLAQDLEKKIITFRPINKININTLHDDLANSDLLIKPKSTLCELVNQYNETLSKLLDKHAPKQTKSVQVRPLSPWMSNDIIVENVVIDILKEFGDELVLQLIDPVILNSYIYAIT